MRAVTPTEGWGREVDSWEARGQSLWKSSDDEDEPDWNSYDDNDYPPDEGEDSADEGDEGEEALEELIPQKNAPSAVSIAATPRILPSLPTFSQVKITGFSVVCPDSLSAPVLTVSRADFDSRGSTSCMSQSAGLASAFDDSRRFRSPDPDPEPGWVDSEEEDSSEYSSSSNEERVPAFNVGELIAHLRELGYSVPESDQPVDLQVLLGKMDEYFQNLFKKQADQRKVVEIELETESIVEEVHQWGKHKTLWMMLNDLSLPNDKCQLKPDAGFDQVSRHYRKVLLRIHPDKNAHKGWREYVRATEQFKLLSAAFHVHKKKASS